MADKFQNKYRIKSARHSNWDYSNEGAYFITICTHDRLPYFGKIINGKMNLSPVGVLADIFWHEIKNHSMNIEFGAFVVMPNHIHGILILNRGNDLDINGGDNGVNHGGDIGVQTLHATSLSPHIKNQQMAKISPKPNSISTIIRSYKSAVTKHANRLGLEFGWQTRFHDHIIRDTKSFDRISHYILNNPANWGKDKFGN